MRSLLLLPLLLLLQRRWWWRPQGRRLHQPLVLLLEWCNALCCLPAHPGSIAATAAAIAAATATATIQARHCCPHALLPPLPLPPHATCLR
eukprot:355986-Chlamydomonas_euryale.AAC.4